MDVELLTITPVAADPPNDTLAPDKNPAPVTITDVPPFVDPDAGEAPLTVGAGLVYVNPLERVPLWPSALVTTTATAPPECAGVVALIDVELPTVTLAAAAPPNVTVAPAANPVPVTVTGVPPEPVLGDTAETVGAGAGTLY